MLTVGLNILLKKLFNQEMVKCIFCVSLDNVSQL